MTQNPTGDIVHVDLYTAMTALAKHMQTGVLADTLEMFRAKGGPCSLDESDAEIRAVTMDVLMDRHPEVKAAFDQWAAKQYHSLDPGDPLDAAIIAAARSVDPQARDRPDAQAPAG
ncbi:hypothetical protein [Nocardia sp. CA-120079]|uniref:hypothetical protein n=1 Tax=Nocardia sp. CA-120079 TaxID=3239974 RepID=UPI003D971D25